MRDGGGFTRRDKLLSLFWPESDAEKGRASLRQSLSFLRKSLGDGVLATRGDEEVGIVAGALDCDALRFDACIERGDARAALGEYGGAFMDGVHLPDAAGLERWLDDERSRLARRAAEAARSVVDDCEGGADLQGAIEWAHKGLELEPLSERWARKLIDLLARAGDRERAIGFYDTFAARLAAELELEPSEETQAAIQSIRTSAPSTTAPAPNASGPTEPESIPPESNIPESTTVAVQSPAVRADTPVSPPPVRYPASRRAITIATLSLAGFIVALMLWGSLGTPSTERVLRYSIAMADGEELRDVAGGRFALSPDGSRFVYTGGPDQRLHVRARDQLRARVLPGTEGSSSPFFSPDGSRVGFFAGGELKVAPLDGGPTTFVSDAVDPWAGATWGRDGSLYAATPGFGGLVRLTPEPNAMLETVTRLDSGTQETDHNWPDALPNGRGILFTTTRAKAGGLGSEFSIAVADLETGIHRVLFDGIFARHAGSGHIVFVTEDSTLMVVPFDAESLVVTGTPTVVSEKLRVGYRRSVDVSVSETGTLMYATGPSPRARELVWVSRDGVVTPLDPPWQGDLSFPSLSPDGSQVAVVTTGGETSDVWIGDLGTGARQRLTMGDAVTGYPSWTPDGRSVTYFSRTLGSSDLLTKPADGSGPATLQLTRPRDLTESLWSPDGRWLIYRTSNIPVPSLTRSGEVVGGAGDILAMQPDGPGEEISVAEGAHAELSPTLSPDGGWLAYVSQESGREEVYVVPFPPTDATRWSVSPDGGVGAVWSQTSGELFYRTLQNSLVAVEVETSPTFALGRSSVLFDTRGYVNDGLHPTYAVSPDGQRFLMLRVVRPTDPGELIMVENWFEELSRVR